MGNVSRSNGGEMARNPNPGNKSGRLATERWRSTLKAAKSPESSDVDIAVAASVAAYATFIVEGKGDPSALNTIVLGAVSILTSRGFDNAISKNKLFRRMGYRKDRFRLLEKAGFKS